MPIALVLTQCLMRPAYVNVTGKIQTSAGSKPREGPPANKTAAAGVTLVGPT